MPVWFILLMVTISVNKNNMSFTPVRIISIIRVLRDLNFEGVSGWK